MADEYDQLKQIKIGGRSLSLARCKEYMNRHKGTMMDPNIVDHLMLVIQDNTAGQKKSKEICLSVHKLRKGMKTSRMVQAFDNTLVLRPETILQEEEIAGLISLINMNVIKDQIYVYTP